MIQCHRVGSGDAGHCRHCRHSYVLGPGTEQGLSCWLFPHPTLMGTIEGVRSLQRGAPLQGTL